MLTSGELFKAKGAFFLEHLHLGHPPFTFSNGRLDKFKNRHSIRLFCHFGESSSMDEGHVVEHTLPSLHQNLDQYD